MTAILAHEIVELVSDPFPTGGKTISEVQNRDGIVDVSLLADKNSQYELADVCANGVFSIVNGTSVEPYWSNIDNGCVVPRSNADLGLITEQVIPNEGTAPDGVVFGQPFDVNPLHLSALDPMHCVSFWLKRVVNAEAETTLNNRFTLHIEAQI